MFINTYNQLIWYSVPHKSKFSYEQVWREYIIVSSCWDVSSWPDYQYRHLVTNFWTAVWKSPINKLFAYVSEILLLGERVRSHVTLALTFAQTWLPANNYIPKKKYKLIKQNQRIEGTQRGRPGCEIFLCKGFTQATPTNPFWVFRVCKTERSWSSRSRTRWLVNMSAAIRQQ